MSSGITRARVTSCCSLVIRISPTSRSLFNAGNDWVGSCAITIKRRRDRTPKVQSGTVRAAIGRSRKSAKSRKPACFPSSQLGSSGKRDRPVKYRFFRRANFLAIRDGKGWVAIEDRGIVITLPTSKGSQASSETIVIPCPDMPTACDALARWSLRAGLRPGEPVFRPITNTGSVLSGRLTDRSVARIVKLRVAQHYVAKGKSPAEAEALAAGFSGHSMRAGYATTAGEFDEAGYRIQHRMRHKSMDTTSGYIRSGEQWTKSGLGKVGF